MASPTGQLSVPALARCPREELPPSPCSLGSTRFFKVARSTHRCGGVERRLPPLLIPCLPLSLQRPCGGGGEGVCKARVFAQPQGPREQTARYGPSPDPSSCSSTVHTLADIRVRLHGVGNALPFQKFWVGNGGSSFALAYLHVCNRRLIKLLI